VTKKVRADDIQAWHNWQLSRWPGC